VAGAVVAGLLTLVLDAEELANSPPTERGDDVTSTNNPVMVVAAGSVA
jgi:hypothetical protein